MDSGSLASEHEADSGVGSMNSFEPPVCISITVPDLGIQKSLQFNPEESVWAAKQQILLSVAKGLREGFNYGLFIPPVNGKAGKFLDDGRLLREYSLTTAFSSLELLMKRRIYKHVMATEKKLKQLHSKSSLKQVMEWVRKGDVDKVIKVTNQGLDPNFIDPDSGETPLTLSISLERPTRMILSLVGGGSHLDYRNSKGLTPLHIAAIQGKQEAIKGLMDLGASANYYDLQGLTPVYHCVCNNTSPRCLEMLLYDHAVLGAMDESNWTELHQACKWGRVQHLELMIYYGANLNAQNTGGSTPLHICAVNNQEDCARVILFRGADKTIKNFANHDASETAIISGNTILAHIIRDFSDEDVVSYQDVPRFNEKRRPRLQTGTLSATPMQRWRSNPQLHLLFHDDQLSTRTANIRNNYDLTLPRDTSLGGKPIRRQSDIPLVSEMFGVKLNQPHFHENGTQRNWPKTSNSGLPLPRTVFLKPGKNGYGFILRGSRGSADDSNFVPTPEVPALQYFSIIAENSMAERAGVRPRDFLLEVNGQNVRRASHDYTVDLIKQTKDNLCLLVVSPADEFKVPIVKAHNTLDRPRQGTTYDPTLNSHVAAQFKKANGGLADLENLERMIDESDRGESDSGTSLKRLFIAPNVQTLERMARVAGAGGNIASVHTRHGKQMAKSMPLGETYQDSIGLCRSRIASLPNEEPRVGNFWRTNSMQNLVSPEVTISEDPREVKIQKPRMFIPKEQALPYNRMFSLPGSESEDGNHLQGAMDNKRSYREEKPVLKRLSTTDGTVAPQRPSPPPPPLPMKKGRLNLVSSRDSSTETKATAEPTGVIAFNAGKMSKSVPETSSPLPLPPLPPPPLPPLRPLHQNSDAPLNTSKSAQLSPHVQPVLNSDNELQNDKRAAQFHHPAVSVAPSLSNSAAQSASKIPHSTAAGATRPPPPPPPLVGSLPPISMKSSSTTQQSTSNEDFPGRKPTPAQNSLLEEIQKKRELLAAKDMSSLSWEEDGQISNNIRGQQSHKLPSQTLAVTSTPSTDASLLSEIQMRRKQMELKAAVGNHVQAEVAEDQMETSETSSSNSQRPFLQDLLKALSSRTKQPSETTTVPSTAGNRDLALRAAGKSNEENIPVQSANLQPVLNRYQHSSPVFPPHPIPPPAPPKFSSPVPPRMVDSFPGVGKTQMSHQRNKSIESLDLDLPPPPPPPAPTFDDLEFPDLDDLHLPLPPPPEDFDLQSRDSFPHVLKSSPVPRADCNARQSISSLNVRNGMVGAKGKEDVNCQPLHMWSVADVASWLKSIELEEHVNAFVENSVDGAKLSQLNFVDWIQLGISDLDQRMQIVQARQRFIT